LANRKERSPAEPEIRNPKPEIRNKSKLIETDGMGKPQHFVAACEQLPLLQCKERKE
jgi:hypothetical protein